MEGSDQQSVAYQLSQQSLHAVFTCGSLVWMCADDMDSVKYSEWLNINFPSEEWRDPEDMWWLRNPDHTVLYRQFIVKSEVLNYADFIC